MSKIKIMSESLSNLIAAGEVVNRPLSVVKELVENSLDAKSSKIEINLKNHGIDLIQVSDNGDGMSRNDLILSIKRHATSKIYTQKDLLKISSLGFRGEALASIFAVSKFEIKSSNGIESNVLIKKSQDEYTIEQLSLNKGTDIKVKNIFYNTPARYSGLSNPKYELSLIHNFINLVSLSKPSIQFILINDDKVIYQSIVSNDLMENSFHIYGEEVSKNLIKVVDKTNNFKITMYLSNQYVSRSSKNNIHIFVNDRLIKDFNITKTIIGSYKNYLHTNEFPIVFLFVETDYSLLDVNIHPHKQQIKINLVEELIDMISFNVKDSLKNIYYVQDFSSEKKSNIEDVYIDLNSSIKFNEDHSELKNPIKLDNVKIQTPLKQEVYETTQTNLFESEVKDSLRKCIKNMSYIGVYKDTYLIFQNEDGLNLIDQHAAQERINYEKILLKFKNRDFSYQSLLVENIISIDFDVFSKLSDNFDALEFFGLKVESFGYNNIRINEIDQFYFKFKNINLEVENLLNYIVKQKNFNYENHFDSIAIMMACKASIKANHHLSFEEAELLLEQLRECEEQFTCPHGRPIILNISNYDLEKMFKRVF